ncbi:hypothetical protein GOP47_0020808 [Adiantum capillus-veneris]|uniref:FAD-binding domain-containing protein n=1 Tax=Adiantum capillus-veneris TaxID=13818 RepID=A0A9D4U9W0_ADICA|nr:hypothetical protein GOP47_0020808 [Adiantum capillus-veneris]
MQVLQTQAAVEHALLLSSSSAPLTPTVGSKSSSHYDLRTVCAAHQMVARGGTAQKPTGTQKAGIWRFLNLEVSADRDPGKDDYSVSRPLIEAIANTLACPVDSLPSSALNVVRKSFDARKVVNKVRKDPRFVYTVDLHIDELQGTSSTAGKVIQFLKNRPGKLEFISEDTNRADVIDLVSRCKIASLVSMTEKTENAEDDGLSANVSHHKHAKITVVGSGPAGLFAALVLAESGAKVILVERGQPVESRGRDIGQLMVRRVLRPDSNFCYGEGGAGTWSDGKLTTRIGRNSDTVKMVFASLVKFGAPPTILLDGKPHIGTDKLIHILRKMRNHLESLGVQIRFGTKMVGLLVKGNRVAGVKVKKTDDLDCEDVISDAVVLAVGHSARDIYYKLLEHDIHLSPKDFSVGFRVEHPQELINEIQYSKWASDVRRGSGKIPVADYKVATSIIEGSREYSAKEKQSGCYSFCMCPGGQIVPTSTNSDELCINGMSFSKRSSKWANSALVMTVSSKDLDLFVSEHGPLAGVAFQKSLEREAAVMGGGDLVVPVQAVPDFLNDKLSGGVLPSSSYRLGVKEAPLHSLFSEHLTGMFKQALVNFDRQIPGFIDGRALLHAVETRTSSPVKIDRDAETFECTSVPGLYPIGEGAGYAGGIVSAAVDGLNAGLALAEQLGLCKDILKEKRAVDKLMYY